MAKVLLIKGSAEIFRGMKTIRRRGEFVKEPVVDVVTFNEVMCSGDENGANPEAIKKNFRLHRAYYDRPDTKEAIIKLEKKGSITLKSFEVIMELGLNSGGHNYKNGRRN